jgi:HEAT repeat protein
MSNGPPPAPLAPDVALRLTEFARACKAATRTVSLYPDGHPAIASSLSRLVETATRATALGPLTITALPDRLMVEGRAPARADPALGELAVLLHTHLVGELRLLGGADHQAWRTFLLLLGRPAEELLIEGGIARLWATAGGQHVQIREIDYSEVLRERTSGAYAAWDQIVAYCLAGDAVDLDEATVKALVDIAADAGRLSELARHIDEEAVESGGVRSQAQALVRLLRLMAGAVADGEPERLDEVLHNAALAAGQVSPEVMLELLTHRSQAPGDPLDVVGAMVDRMSDTTIATFVASSVITERGATARLAQAFQALVPDGDRRDMLVELVQAEVMKTPLGRESSFEDLWKRASQLLLSYSDEKFVSTDYARELTTARTQAIDVERVSDDPPERVAAWMATVTDAEVRQLDLQLLLDLLRVEDDPDRWQDVLEPAVAHVNDLVLLGDLEAAVPLANAIASDAGGAGRPERRMLAASAIDRLAGGHLMTAMVGHLRTVDETLFEHAKTLCHALGSAVIRPLAEALAAEEAGRAFRRLTDILVSFGSRGRDAVEQLKNSANPAVRRTAIHLLRQFGGNDALAELMPLVEDRDPNVQREAIRAIVNIGTNEAFAVLEHALGTGRPQSREAITSALVSTRDERAVPLFAGILQNREYRRTLRPVYESAVAALGAIGGLDAVAALKDALYDGEWWAPFRTSAIRVSVATALGHTGSPEALAVLRDAAAGGSRSVRAAARHQLAHPTAVRRAEPRTATDEGTPRSDTDTGTPRTHTDTGTPRTHTHTGLPRTHMDKDSDEEPV